jgi:GAF domain-containing protein
MSPASIEPTTNVSGPDPARALSAFATRGYGDAGQAAQAILELIRGLVGLRICVLTRIDLAANTLTVLEAHDGAGLGVVKGMVLPADSMPCASVVRDATALREVDLDAHPVFRGLPAREKLGLRSYLGVPLRRSDGTVSGTLAATDTNALETTEEHVHAVTVLARLAALELERDEQRDAAAGRLALTEALEEERLRASRMQAVLEAAATVSHDVNNPLTVLQLRLGSLARRLPTDAETTDDLDVALQAAAEIHRLALQLRDFVRPMSTRHSSARTRLRDLDAPLEPAGGATGDD